MTSSTPFRILPSKPVVLMAVDGPIRPALALSSPKAWALDRASRGPASAWVWAKGPNWMSFFWPVAPPFLASGTGG